MERTQIYLTPEDIELLERQEERTGASRSELIRRAIRQQYAGRDRGARTTALMRSAGSWKGRTFTGAEYVDGVRGDLNERLRRLGLQ